MPKPKPTEVSIYDGNNKVGVDASGRITVILGQLTFAHGYGGAVGTLAGVPILGHDYTGTGSIIRVDTNGRLSVNVNSMPSITVGSITNDYTRQLGRVGLVNPASGAIASVNQPDWSDPIGLAVTSGYDSGGQTGMLRTDSVGRLLVTLVSAGSDTERSSIGVTGTVAVSGGSISVSGTVAVSTLPSIPAGTNNIGDVDVLTLPVLPAGTNRIGKVNIKDETSGYDLSLKKIGELYSSETGILALGGDGTNLRLIKTNSSGNVDVVGTVGVSSISSPVTLSALPAGTNNIGDVDVLTLPTLPSGTNYIGRVRLHDGTTNSTLESTGSLDVIFKDATGVLELLKAGNAHSGSPIGIALMGNDGANARMIRTDGSGVLSINIGSLPAGTNNIGDVDVLSVIPGTGTTNLGKASGNTAASGDVGVAAFSKRVDTPSAQGAANKYQPQNLSSIGTLWNTPNSGYFLQSFASTGQGTAIDCPANNWALQVVAGAATTWTVSVETSVNGTDWDTAVAVTHTNVTPGNKQTIRNTTAALTRYWRINVSAANGSTTVYCQGVLV